VLNVGYRDATLTEIYSAAVQSHAEAYPGGALDFLDFRRGGKEDERR
jgi:hypothetical protein